MISETKPIFLTAPVINNQLNQMDLQLDEFTQISSKFINSSMSIDELILQLRGGDKFKDISFIILFILLYKLQQNRIEGFPVNPVPHPQWMTNGADRRPPYARGYGYWNSGSGSSLGLSSQSSNLSVSNNGVPTKTQISGFLKNKKVDLNKCLNEVKRRAFELGCTDFDCSLERFRALATENGDLNDRGAKEAITILQGEMLGFYKNSRREDYGSNITGPDFIVEGVGVFKDITHVEVKNPVGSMIKIVSKQSASISRQGKNIGAKLRYQQSFWSDKTKTSKLENVNSIALFPQSSNNVLGLVDNFDVPSNEKAFMEASIIRGYRSDRNIIFLNNN